MPRARRVSRVDVLRERRNVAFVDAEPPGGGECPLSCAAVMCVVWKGTNLIPGYYNHLDAFNEVTAAAFLAAGFSVADPGEVTKANVGVADVHHHQNIFNGEILKPLLPALERICPE